MAYRIIKVSTTSARRSYNALGQIGQVKDTETGRIVRSFYDAAARPMRKQILTDSGISAVPEHIYTATVKYSKWNDLRYFIELVGQGFTKYVTKYNHDEEHRTTGVLHKRGVQEIGYIAYT